MYLPDILILAGGKAKRLGKVTKNIPKSLINFYKKPFIYYQLCLLERNKFKKIVISTGHLSKKLKYYINKNKKKFNLKIKFINDGKNLLGTGGAIKNAISMLSKDFFVIFGDSYLDVDYLKIYKKFLFFKKLGLMTVYKNNNLNDKTGEGLSDIEIHNGKIIKYDKLSRNSRMEYINYGISVFNKNLFKKWEFKKKMDLQVINQELIDNKELSYLIIKKQFYETGSKKGIKLTKQYLKEKYKK